ncbi:MAG: hypothetical protein ORN51_00875 [Akkermansiaceae bacterium]|nr:hypothetical protein [Akkermansiaceae bacterium]
MNPAKVETGTDCRQTAWPCGVPFGRLSPKLRRVVSKKNTAMSEKWTAILEKWSAISEKWSAISETWSAILKPWSVAQTASDRRLVPFQGAIVHDFNFTQRRWVA